MDMGPRVLNPSLACFPCEDGILRNVLLLVGQLSGGGRCTVNWGRRPTGPGDTKQRPAPKGTGRGRQAISSKAVGPALYSRGNPCGSSRSRSPLWTHCGVRAGPGPTRRQCIPFLFKEPAFKCS